MLARYMLLPCVRPSVRLSDVRPSVTSRCLPKRLNIKAVAETYRVQLDSAHKYPKSMNINVNVDTPGIPF